MTEVFKINIAIWTPQVYDFWTYPKIITSKFLLIS